MNRVVSWNGLAIAIGLLLAVAVICIAIGNTGLAAALIVVAVVEGSIHALVITAVSARRRRCDSETA